MIGALSHTRHAPVASTPASSTPGEDPKLRKVAQQMEGVFVQELYKAMRATVPQNDGAVGGGAGEEMFTGLMDQHLATETPQAWGRGLGEAIYEHLRGRLAREGGTAAPTAPDAGAAGSIGSAGGPLDAPQAARALAEPPALMPLQQQSLLQPLHPTLLNPSRDAGR